MEPDRCQHCGKYYYLCDCGGDITFSVSDKIFTVLIIFTILSIFGLGIWAYKFEQRNPINPAAFQQTNNQ